MSTGQVALETADWRRRTFALYDLVREAAETSSAHAHAIWREGRDAMLATHPATPVLPEDRAGFTGVPVADYDPEWRFEVALQTAEPLTFDFETGTDGIVHYERLGIASVPGVGDLDVWRHTGYGGGIFLPIRDGLAGHGTYGGGRYLLDTIKGADLGADAASGSVVLDFNFAYNPSCAYDPAWACPLAPLGDRVSVDIPVGELYEGRY